MKALASHLRPAIVSTLLFAVICCGIYPLAVTGIARTLFRHQADGSLITLKDGSIVGSGLIGQNFRSAKYFHPRPSAAGANGHDAMASGGSNLGPTSLKLEQSIAARVAAYRAENSLTACHAVPADAVTASASGLDPHISPANAALQVNRVAIARGLDPVIVLNLVSAHTEARDFGILGEERVNVLKLNLALDQLRNQAP